MNHEKTDSEHEDLHDSQVEKAPPELAAPCELWELPCMRVLHLPPSTAADIKEGN